MGEVERLLTAALVTVEATDPEHPDARHCMRQYSAELHRRFEAGFDPAPSITADPEELRPPAGVVLVARLPHVPSAAGR